MHERIHQLTPREREVLGCVAQGLSNQQTAERLCVSERTIRTHVSAILCKTGTRNRTQLARQVWASNMQTDGFELSQITPLLLRLRVMRKSLDALERDLMAIVKQGTA